jgi:hypothetical protein
MRAGIGQEREGPAGVPGRVGHQGEAPGGNSFPAGIAELARLGEGLPEQFAGAGRIAPGQLDLGPQCLGPGQEGQPMVTLGQADRRIELPGGGIQGTAEQVDPAQHGQPVRLPPRLPGSFGQRDRLLQQADSFPVAGAVAFHRAQVGEGLRADRR